MTMRTSCYRLFAGLVFSAAFLIVPVQTEGPVLPGPIKIGHDRIAVHRNDDGTLKRGTLNQIETSNWSGYAVANFSTTDTYTIAQASWTVPKVSYVAPPPVCHVYNFFGRQSEFCTSTNVSAEYSSSWVGIGGYCESNSCTTVDNTLIQLGTEQDVSSRGETQYYAWIEMLPNSLVTIPHPVYPGDAITASLTCQSNCSPSENQSWSLSMQDSTAGHSWTWTTTVTYTSTLLSAEWIQEAPSSYAGVLPLADFVTASFDPTADAVAPVLPGSDAIQMVDPYGETSNPSAAATGAFSACWGNGSFASCATP